MSCVMCHVFCALWSVFCDLISKNHTGNCVIRNGHIRKARYEWLICNGHIRNARYQWPTTQCNRQNVTDWILPSQACDLNITKSSMSEYYQSPITMSEFTTSYITNGFKNHQSTSYITNGFKNHQSTYKVNKKGSISTIHTSSLLFPCFMDFDGFPMVASQVWCFFIWRVGACMACQRKEFHQIGCIPPPQQHFQPQQSFFSQA